LLVGKRAGASVVDAGTVKWAGSVVIHSVFIHDETLV